ncbi:MAG: hypothetical protein WA213_15210 [Terriglobales bacterium]
MSANTCLLDIDHDTTTDQQTRVVIQDLERDGWLYAETVWLYGRRQMVFRKPTQEQNEAMPPLQEYIDNADMWTQSVVDRWGASVITGNVGELPPDFMALFDLANNYRTAKQTADNRCFMREHATGIEVRQVKFLSEADAGRLENTRLEFARACKVYRDTHPVPR